MLPLAPLVRGSEQTREAESERLLEAASRLYRERQRRREEKKVDFFEGQ